MKLLIFQNEKYNTIIGSIPLLVNY